MLDAVHVEPFYEKLNAQLTEKGYDIEKLGITSKLVSYTSVEISWNKDENINSNLEGDITEAIREASYSAKKKPSNDPRLYIS